MANNVQFQSSVPATPSSATIVETIDQGGGVQRQVMSIASISAGVAIAVSSATVTLSSVATVTPSSAINVNFVGIPLVNISSGTVTLSSNPTVTLSSNPTITGSVVPIAGSAGGATNTHFFTSTAAPDANLIKASAGTLYGVQAVNISSAPTYLKLFDASTGATTVGVTTPYVTIPIPSALDTGAGISAPFPVGIAFVTAISYALTGASSDSDTSTTLSGTTLNVQFG